MINDYTLMEINKIHESFMLNTMDHHPHIHTRHKASKVSTTTTKSAEQNAQRKKQLNEVLNKAKYTKLTTTTTQTPTIQTQTTKNSTNNSLLNCCEEQINENEEYKRLNVRRALSVKTSDSQTTKESNEKKVVRFADALGLDLVSVKLIFNPDSPPCIPRKVISSLRKKSKLLLNQQQLEQQKFSYYNNLDDDDVDDDDDDDEDAYDECTYNNPLQLQQHQQQTDTPLSPDIFEINNLKFKWNKLFEQPGILPNFYTKLNEKKLSLESVYLKSNCLTGIIRVLNVSFSKIVQLRYTIDNWLTYHDIDAIYIANSCDGHTDRFNFNINLDLINKPLENFYLNSTQTTIDAFLFKKILTLEFAVSFKTSTSSDTYWDNNNNLNYKIELLNLVNNNNNNSNCSNILMNDPLRKSLSPVKPLNLVTESELFNLTNTLSAAFV